MYIKPLSAIMDSHSIIHHSFADDLQLQMSAPPDRISELLHSMRSCISDVKAWATANMLKLNDNKTPTPTRYGGEQRRVGRQDMRSARENPRG